MGITYDTLLKKYSKLILSRRDLAEHEGCNEAFPPKVYFKTFNASSLDFWPFIGIIRQTKAYMRHADQVNMDVLARFNEAGIEFAFPSQTLYFGRGRFLQIPLYN